MEEKGRKYVPFRSAMWKFLPVAIGLGWIFGVASQTGPTLCTLATNADGF